MANWAKLQEDLVGLPVAKRAKHGIHFQKSAGEFVANFSGAPCHYQDGGIWKPIDTKLLPLGDGFYGCPHSKVKVHPDGRVAVAGTDYAQRVELPSAKTGLADGDKLIREFSFGKQEMRITEDGFRSEIQLNRIPTLKEARKLIASESGTLSKEYLKSLTTATDANGNMHTYTTLTAFRTWLAAATFPVVIDPDFAGTSNADTYLNSSLPLRNYGAATGSYPIHTYLFRFDLSSIDSDNTCTDGSFTWVAKNSRDSSQSGGCTLTLYKITDANGDWIEGTKTGQDALSGEPCWNAKESDGSGGVTTAWAGSTGMATAGTDYVNTALANIYVPYIGQLAGNEYVGDFTSEGISVFQSWFGQSTNNGFLIKPTSGIAGWLTEFGLSEATESYRPVLTVTYTAGGALLKVNMNAQMSNLTGGMHG